LSSWAALTQGRATIAYPMFDYRPKKNAPSAFTASGGAASDIKRRESLDFRGFFEGKAGAGQLFDFGIFKVFGKPRPAPDALSQSVA